MSLFLVIFLLCVGPIGWVILAWRIIKAGLDQSAQRHKELVDCFKTAAASRVLSPAEELWQLTEKFWTNSDVANRLIILYNCDIKDIDRLDLEVKPFNQLPKEIQLAIRTEYGEELINEQRKLI